LTINLVFISGLIALATGLFLAYGLPVALIIIGGLLIALALAAALKSTNITVENKNNAH
jgi:hypothetical protein